MRNWFDPYLPLKLSFGLDSKFVNPIYEDEFSYSNSVWTAWWCCPALPAHAGIWRIDSGPAGRFSRKLAPAEHGAGLTRELSVLPDVDVASVADEHVVIINPCRYSNVAVCGSGN